MRQRVVALWCAVMVATVACAPALAYTVDCNQDYTDCDNELNKQTSEDYDVSATTITSSSTTTTTTVQPQPKMTTPETTTKLDVDYPEASDKTKKLTIDDLMTLASLLHNKSTSVLKAKSLDLSDINFDSEEEDKTVHYEKDEDRGDKKDKFAGSDELDGTCKDSGIVYKIGEKIERGCEETCECVPGGTLHCTQRCKHPYIRRGRRLDDPLCFESPVDECCSIIACSTGNGDSPHTLINSKMCRYGKDTYPIGATWHVECEQTCSCEGDNIVNCKPRCPELSPSDKCINVQDPHDACCEVQVCDVSQDAHEQHDNSSSTTPASTNKYSEGFEELEDELTSTAKPKPKSTMRPLVLTEPIGSVKVLSNNTVQVNLVHQNNSIDPIHLLLSSDGGTNFREVELKYSNLILNLEDGKEYVLKTKETGTKFNFNITTSYGETRELPLEVNETKIGCHEDGKFYSVGEEFRVGCVELCECTGKESRDCVPLQCPNHVGLELVSRSCVQWAPGPPPTPPNCCPRSARCLSDGSCNYSGHTVPNWSEVPISLTGCEKRCFCENGELDCQDVCSPVPALPPQTLRCPPMFRPALVNISAEDCCKHWGCLPNANYSRTSITPQDENIVRIPLGFSALNSLAITTTNYVESDVKAIKSMVNDKDATKVSYYGNLNGFNDGGNKYQLDIVQLEKKLEPTVTLPTLVAFKPTNYNVQIEPMYENKNNVRPKYMQVITPEAKQYPKKFINPSKDFNLFRPAFDNQDEAVNLEAEETEPPVFFKPDKYFKILPRKKYKISNSRPAVMTNLRNKFSNNQNPYLTLLSLPDHVGEPTRAYQVPRRDHSRSYTYLDLGRVMRQMESTNHRNFERSSENFQDLILEAGATMQPDFNKPHQPAFLPTIPPEIIQYPQDLQDYDQNNIHRPDIIDHPNLSSRLPVVPTKFADDNKKLSVLSLAADSPTSIKMLFGLPSVLVGLRGSVDLRYTDKPDDDVSQWHSQIFAPTDEILSTSRLEFRLTGLKPGTRYRVRGKLYLHNLPVEPESDVFSVTTPEEVTVEEKRREVNSKLTVVDVNDTVAHVIWRHFTEEELLLIDAIQVRYRPVGTPIYLMTELLHHSRSAADLHDLRPGSRYEASLVLVPPPRAVTELIDPNGVEFNTLPYIDPYNWSVQVEARSVGSTAAELTWHGIPSPAERWVRVYRAAHACGDGRATEHDMFRLAVREQPPAITLTGLEPNTRCRVWLELFLTNGKVKTSNVLEINTKSQEEHIDNEIEQASSIGARDGNNRGDYYGALVVVGVIAALGAVISMLLLLIVVRRHRPRSVPITPVPSAPRESSLPPYDNPAYKLELQQETMDL